MFQVPGWNVSAKSLVPQTADGQKVKRKHLPHDPSAGDSDNPRKRNRASEEGRQVTGDDLHRFWNAQFASSEDREKSRKATRVGSRKHKQKQRARQGDVGDERLRDGLQHTPRAEEAIPPVSTPSPDHKSVRAGQRAGRTVKAEKHVGPSTTLVPSGDHHEVHLGPAKQGQKDRQRQQQKQKQRDLSLSTMPAAPQPPLTLPPPAPTAPTALTPLQAKMRAKLTSSRFRHLNQTLYTTSSSAALALFSQSPELFAEYHAGFSQQVKSSWPQNPVDQYISAIQTRGSLKDGRDWKGLQPLPRRKTGSCTIADLGCGDAPLARALQAQIKPLQLKFHNYDLQSPNSLVTVADIASLPLRDGEADIAIFCLSLMGTNWLTFIDEAWRSLRGDGKGEMWVAEVKSRFGRVTRKRVVVENSVGKKRKPTHSKHQEDGDGPAFAEDVADQPSDDTDISSFVGVIERRGFALKSESVNKANKMFVSMVFVKAGVPTAGKYKGWKWAGKGYHTTKVDDDEDEGMSAEDEAKVLKPCVYKNR